MIPACDAWAEIRRAIAAHPQKGSFLDVGGRDGRHTALAEGFRDYTILDLEPHGLYTELAAYDAALRLEDLRGSGLLDRAGIVRRRLVKRKVLHIGRKP